MPRKSTNGTDTTENTVETQDMPTRSEPITVTGTEADNIAAAWKGVRHLFKGEVERWDVTHDGLVAVNFTVDGDYDPQEIIDGISARDRRVEFLPTYWLVQGEQPEPFTDSLSMTKWMQQYFRKPGEDGKSPEFVKRAIAAYKKDNDFPARKGRPKKVIRLENLGSLDMAALQGVNGEELEKLYATLQAAIKAKGAKTAETATA